MAEEIRVRSGEHASFSRLVITFAEPTEWSFGRDATGYEFQAARADVTLDLSAIFTRIPRNRIKDVSALGSNGFRIEMDCACHSESFEISPGKVVIDIKDGTEGETAPQLAVKTAQAADVRPQELANLAGLGGLAVRQPLPVLGAEMAVEEPMKPSNSEDTPVASSEAEFRSILVQELGRAAMQGLVEADIDIANNAQAAGEEPPTAPAPISAKPPRPPQAPGIRIETVVDRDLPDISALQTAQGSSCHPDAFFDLTAWRGTGSPAELIVRFRNGLIGEFDRIDHAQLDGLIQTYLALGFGLEVLTLLEEFPRDGAKYQVAKAMAHIVDHDLPPVGNALAGHLACDSDVALWAVLAREQLPRGEFVNTVAVGAAFSALPIDMRRHLADPLAERFLAVGNTEVVARIHAAVDRAPGPHGPHVDLMKARVDLAEGRTDAASANLESIVSADVPVSPEALALLLEQRNARGEPASAHELGNAEALAFEYGGTEIGARLLRDWTISNAFSGRFSAAFAQMAVAPDAQKQGLAEALWDPLTRLSDDSTFLGHALYLHRSGLATGISPEGRLALADRLNNLGFADEASQILGPVSVDETDDMRLVRAQIAIAQKDAQLAMRHVAGLTGTKAAAVRGNAQATLGNLEQAISAYRNGDIDDKASAAAWQTGDWAVVEQIGTDLQKRFVQFQANTQVTVDRVFVAGTVPNLAELGDLASDAEQARKLLKKMLSTPAGG
ncbi:hypothetical protein ACMU_02205 [Actibacterium mucosum KCTC 23349]|uniref:Uncharacterized protein n=1 Tax=Actibacterium mucosum KCTC 23349 TaxID=1454373 RepID=A0A037ZNU9_9RHOB|nr:hypothetical protein ACMU_02205 [Actibacterium mucosum KCTC 23349]